MEPDIGRLIKRLIIHDEQMLDQRTALLDALVRPEKVRAFIDILDKERESSQCYSCNEKGNCLALLGAAYFNLGEYKKAIHEGEFASQFYRGTGDDWNKMIALELLGWAYECDGNRHQAEQIYKEAIHDLKYIYMHQHADEHDKGVTELRQELELLIKEPLKGVKPPKAAGKTRTVLSIARMPVFAGVQAGPDGPTWQAPLPGKNFTDIEDVLLEDKPHKVFSLVRGTHSFTLASDKQYGWAKVMGDSMSACTPATILHDDYILFYKTDTAPDNSIVIAARPDPAGSGYQYVVKRYDQHAASLLSETEPAGTYAPIPITEEVRILGLAIAVAKPA
jgi:tetratricopeptide (TPR) repeat protein